MRSFRTLLALIVCAVLLGVATHVSADTWDYVYGDDPTNGNNVSGFTNVRADPLGGVFVAGYFFGSFEGLNSGNQWSLFIQHRNLSGSVDWTVPYASIGGGSPPSYFSNFMEVDGEGTLFFQNNINGQFISLTRDGTRRQASVSDSYVPQSVNSLGGSSTTTSAPEQTTTTSSTTTSSTTTSSTTSLPKVVGSSCPRRIADRSGGLIVICGTTMKKFDRNFTELWSVDVSTRLGGQNEAAFGNSGIGTLVQGADQSVWIVGNFNSANLGKDPSTIPAVFRTYLALTNYSTTNGSETVSIKHFGLVGFDAYAAGERNLWVHTISGQGGRERVTVFRATNGERIGDVNYRFGLFEEVELFSLRFEEIRNKYGFAPSASTGFCSDVLLREYRWEFPRGNPACGASTTEKVRVLFTNDGRRVALSADRRIWVFELDGDDLPSIGRLIMRKDFDANITDFDMDDIGNLYVVGSTSTFQVVASSSETRERLDAFGSTRGFIVRNPGGSMGLTVLPRTPLTFKVTGSNGVPTSGVGAVSMNVTVVSPGGEGYITVYPCGTRPEASNLNYVVSQTVPNAVIAPVSADGEVCFYTYAETHLLADINGYFPAGQGFVAVTPVRVADTRAASEQGARTVPKVKIGGPTELRFQATGITSVTPASGVGAVSMNVTVTNAVTDDFGGYLTVYPCGTRPEASSLNFRTGQTVPNAVISPVSANGEICIWARGTADVIVDINGYFPAGQGFVAVTPARVADTRAASDQGLRTVNKTRIGGDTELRVKVTDLAGIVPATGVGAVSMNVTATNNTTDNFGGYLTVYPCGSRPEASNVNFSNNQTVPNAVISPVSANGEICIWARGTTDVIVDINGYFPTGQGFVALTPVRAFDTR